MEKRKNQKADDRLFYIGVLTSEQCQCERIKKQGRALCFGCFIKLPGDLARALYRPIGAGFEAAYDDCCRYLNE